MIFTASMRIGLDVLLTNEKQYLKNKRLGILAQSASRTSTGKHIVEALTADWKVTTLFGPEHGIRSNAVYMEAVDSTVDSKTGLPVYSLYGKTAKSLTPQKKMLKNIDTLIIDLQDVGSRYYTYVWTTLLCIEACGKYKKKVIVCDRPNPINGISIEGELNQKGYTSFVGLYPLPVRHGMTIGEIARFFNDIYDLGCELTIIPMERWDRKMYWEETGIPWTHPSPNMRSPTQALLYPGMCLLEGTNVSEGRGTEMPFEIVGAPFIDSKELMEAMADFDLDGVTFDPTVFTPTGDKWKGERCHGIRMKVTKRRIFKPYATGIALIWALYYHYHEKGFRWRMEPYEFIEDIPAIDLLTGGETVRSGIEKHLPLSEILEWVGEPSKTFLRQRTPYLLY